MPFDVVGDTAFEARVRELLALLKSRRRVGPSDGVAGWPLSFPRALRCTRRARSTYMGPLAATLDSLATGTLNSLVEALEVSVRTKFLAVTNRRATRRFAAFKHLVNEECDFLIYVNSASGMVCITKWKGYQY